MTTALRETATPAAGRWAGIRRWWSGSSPAAVVVGYLFVSFVAFRLNANFVLNHFYADGAGVDAWLIGAAIWRNDWTLTLPSAAVFPLHSFLGTHFTFLLVVPALLSHLIPVGMISWTAVVVGAIHALLAVAVYRLALRDYALATRGGVVLAAALGLGFGFGGIAMAALQLPHFELLIVGLGLLFLAALARGRHRAAWFWFVLAMLVREDAGFHLFGVLILAQIVAPRRDAWIFVAMSFIWSAASFGLIKLFFPGDNNFERVYAGAPAYAHLTRDLVEERLRLIWSLRTYLWLPPIVALAWALMRRDALVLVGFAAALPWALLHLTAVTGGAGTLDLYYSFPFLLAVGWSMVAPVWRKAAVPVGRDRRFALIGQSALIASALVGWVGERFVIYPLTMKLNVDGPTLNADLIENFATRLAQGLPDLGTVRADYGSLGLVPGLLRPTNWLSAQSPGGADTVIWFDPGQQDSLAWGSWLSSRLGNHYQVVGSNIMIATNRRLHESPLFAPAVVPGNAVWRRMRPTLIAERTPDGFFAARDRPAGLIADGPHGWWRYGMYFAHGVAIPTGRYEARFDLRVANPREAGAVVARLEVGFAWGPTVARAEIRADQLRPESISGAQPILVTVPFAVDATTAPLFLQLRALHLGTADVTLRAVGLV
ncbi:MAG: hypothetical protein JNL66_18900, partial [Alphaproteobacteria bacterium]|nr:hypothetical protein [Alphaproteobacteria bacterium]